MIRKTTLFLLALPAASAFVHQSGWQKLIRHKTLASVLEDSKLEPVDFDLERAKQCAEHFGECSVEELEKLQASLRKEHLQSFVFGHPESTSLPEEAFQHRLIEEEISLQLSLLKEQMPKSNIFPEAEETLHPPKKHTVEDIPEPATDMFVQQGTAMMMLDEETLEAAAFCLVIAVVTLGLLQL